MTCLFVFWPKKVPWKQKRCF